ncbi:hypothetical protein [Nonomuraea sp. NPDC052265]|uniref:hypothetical protein n=1 Tax=Nonomuraea sp. NPDC052265 TaxID=3364374 RepID=UPI0037C7D39B
MSAEFLIDCVWGEEPPAGAVNGLVSRLRRTLGGPESVELVAGGYRLPLRPEDVDTHRFEQLAGQARRELTARRPREASCRAFTARRLSCRSRGGCSWSGSYVSGRPS